MIGKYNMRNMDMSLNYKLTSNILRTYIALFLYCITLLSRMFFYFLSSRKKISVAIKRIKYIVLFIWK